MAVRSRFAGVACAVGAAALFGASTPLAKELLPSVSPILLAGLLYVASGLGLGVYRIIRGRKANTERRLARGEASPFAGALARAQPFSSGVA